MKLFIFKRKLLTLAVCMLCAAVMFYVVNHPAIVGAAAATRQLPIYCVQRDQKVISLSFDAAWGDAIVRQSLSLLGRNGLPHSFSDAIILYANFMFPHFGWDTYQHMYMVWTI